MVEGLVEHFNNYTSKEVSKNIILVGNKCDLNDKRQVSFEEGERMAKKLGVPFFECSAKSNNLIDDIFFRSTKNSVDIFKFNQVDKQGGPKNRPHMKG